MTIFLYIFMVFIDIKSSLYFTLITSLFSATIVAISFGILPLAVLNGLNASRIFYVFKDSNF